MPGKKDPNKPKGRITAYAFFVQHCNQDPKTMDFGSDSSEDDEGPAIARRARKVSKKWKAMTDEDKQPFVEKAEDDKKRYEREMKTFVPSADAEPKGRRGKNKKAKDPTKPKRSMSAFFFFSGEKRASVKEELEKSKAGNGTVGNVAKKLGEMWSHIEDKTYYNDKARKDKARYDHELDMWRKGEFSREDEEEYSDAED